jgi:ferrochelatase
MGSHLCVTDAKFFVEDFLETVTRSHELPNAIQTRIMRLRMLFHHAHDPSTIRKGVVLVNFGTPSSPSRKAICSFLLDLFQDQHFHLPPFVRHLFVRSCLIPFRINKTVARYRAIWTEEGSPLLVQSKRFAQKLSSLLEDDTAVAIAMLYGKPSIACALELLKERCIEEIAILPLFPQQVPSLTHSIGATVFHLLLQWPRLPRVNYIPEFYNELWYIAASAERLLLSTPAHYDHVVFSFHAIPEDRSSSTSSYRNQCIHSAQDIARAAGIGASNISISFQSHVGYGQWTSPATHDVLSTLLKEDKKRILVMCPSFMVDCIETIGEIAGETRADFLGQGGEFLGLVEGLNDFRPYVEGIAAFLKTSVFSMDLRSPLHPKL